MLTQRLEEKRVEEQVGEGERESERGREREWEKERERESAHARGREREQDRALAPPFICFFPPLGPALCKLGLARGAVCSTWSLHSGPWTFLWPSFVLFSWAFPLLVFEPPPFWTPFTYSTYLTDLIEAEDIKKRWQEYTEELHKKIFMTQITTMLWSLT